MGAKNTKKQTRSVLRERTRNEGQERQRNKMITRRKYKTHLRFNWLFGGMDNSQKHHLICDVSMHYIGGGHCEEEYKKYQKGQMNPRMNPRRPAIHCGVLILQRVPGVQRSNILPRQFPRFSLGSNRESSSHLLPGSVAGISQ